ncbi:TrkH-domain-containing protein, partial [Russula ochroleuca]
IEYIDALFICVSGVTGTGLVTVNLSPLTPWQQVIVVLVSLVGSPVFVSLVTVYVRKRYFTKNLDWVIRSEFERSRMQDYMQGRNLSIQQSARHVAHARRVHDTLSSRPVIRRVDTDPRPISSTDFGGMPLPCASSHASSVTRPYYGRNDRYDMLYESSITSAVSTITPQHSDDFLGGFGNPLDWSMNCLTYLFPSFKRNLQRALTTPQSPVLFVPDQGEIPPGAHPVSYLTFPARVGHNSRFIGLSDDDHKELGGLEYRALAVLLWIVSGYYIAMLLIPLVALSPYMSMSKWKDDFLPPNQHRVINPVWYTAFQVVGGWANTGFSLVDQNLVPFQTAYPLLISMVWLPLAGNTGFVSALECRWVNYKLAPKGCKWRETLHFILDHPRRCFIYLFPSRQTWFLFTVLILLKRAYWFCFLVLNIGIPAFDAVPVGQRFLLGLVQAVSVRFAGFQSIAISVLAPAVQVLYFVMMYVSAYFLGRSRVRTTNVYEERSLGIFEDENDDIENEVDYPATDSRVAIWGRYLSRHTRQQLSFDLWWLALALFLICIAERDQLRNTDNASWFTVFAISFEIVSAYGTSGLSLGVPSEHYSLSGAMNTFSKLVICAVMLRGRHRGLPVALDKAIMFPTEFVHKASEKVEEKCRTEAAASGRAAAPTVVGRGESCLQLARTRLCNLR